jgi:hypothetical protein
MTDEDFINSRRIIEIVYRILTNVEYECEGRVYTLDDDSMGNIFFLRDLCEEFLRNEEK